MIISRSPEETINLDSPEWWTRVCVQCETMRRMPVGRYLCLRCASPSKAFPRQPDWQLSLPRLKAVRKAQGFSQEDIGRIAGLSRITIGLIERGQTKPRLRTARMLAEALGVSVDDLSSGAEGVFSVLSPFSASLKGPSA